MKAQILLALSAISLLSVPVMAQNPTQTIRSKQTTVTIERHEPKHKDGRKVHRPKPFSDRDDRPRKRWVPVPNPNPIRTLSSGAKADKVLHPKPFSDKDDRPVKRFNPPKGGAPAETKGSSTR